MLLLMLTLTFMFMCMFFYASVYIHDNDNENYKDNDQIDKYNDSDKKWNGLLLLYKWTTINTKNNNDISKKYKANNKNES